MKRHDEFQFQPAARLAAFRAAAFWPLLWLAVLGCLPPAVAQEPPCFSIDSCNNLRLMIVRDSAYTPPGCPSMSLSTATCSEADAFYQVTYRVYLRYTVDSSTPDSLLDFNLNHARFNTRIRLVSTNGTSSLDHNASYTCFLEDAGANWDLDDKVIWDGLTANEIAIDFMNETSSPVLDCGATDARIHFSLNAPGSLASPLNVEPCPSSRKCTYAYLFPVVVRTYPGDVIHVECAGLDYESNDPFVSACSPSPCAVNSNSSGFNGIFNYTVPLAAVPTGDNADLEVRLTDADTSASTPGAMDIDVEIINTGTANITVDYLEFKTKLDIDVIIPNLQFATNTPLTVEKVHTGGTTYDYFLHYVIQYPSGQVIKPNIPVKLSTLTIGPPMPFNQNWEGVVSLIDEDNSRVRSSNECSRLVLSDITKTIEVTEGEDPCGVILPDDVYFTIRGQSDSTGGCTPPKILMGFYTTQTSTVQLVFDFFECKVEFDLSGDLSIDAVNFINDWDCGTNTGCYSNCYEVDTGNPSLLKIQICDPDNIILNSSNNYEAFFEVEFDGVGCVNGADLQKIRYQRQSTMDPCVPLFDNSNEGIPVCGTKINGHIVTETDKGIEDVKVYMAQYINDATCNDTLCPIDSTLTNSAGEFLFCACSACNRFELTPFKNNDPLNGVSTYDLVLINKHILGLEQLNSLYKWIAADANNSKSVSTFDIVTLRKLILGIDTIFLNNTSWRFVQSDYVFPDTLNPWSQDFSETDSVPPSTIDFIGIKIGDMNGNAVTSSRPIERPLTTVAWSVSKAKGSQTLTVPVYYTGTEPLEAFQLGVRFDPAVLQLIGPSKGDLPATTMDNFGLVKADQGEVRMLWLPDGSELEQYVLPGNVLFYLSFNLLAPLPESGLPMWIDNQVLESLAWRPDALEYSLHQESTSEINRFSAADSEAKEALRASCRPNPTTTDAIFKVYAPQAGPGRIALFDAFGKLVFMRKVLFQIGEQDILAPEVATAPAGVYVWKVYARGKKISGHLIKQ